MTQIANGKPDADLVLGVGHQARPVADFDAPVRRIALRDQDAGSLITADVAGLHIALRRGDVEASVPPLVPYGRKQDRSIGPVGGEHGDDRQFEETRQVVRSEVPTHPRSITRRE